MRVGLIDVDGHNYPNLPMMKLSAYHKAAGDEVEWYYPLLSGHMEKIYVSRVFSFSEFFDYPMNADAVQYGGSGFIHGELQERFRSMRDELIKKVGLEESDRIPLTITEAGKTYQDILPYEAEHIYPDYSLYGITDTAYGFTSRGRPRGCHFCIVGCKEGKKSRKVADLDEFWRGQKEIKLMDPNLLACPEHLEILQQLVDSKAWVDINQGLDARLLTEKNTELIKKLKVKMLHFAWDNPEDEDLIVPKLKMFKEITGLDRRRLTVYTLINFNSTIEQDLHRIYTLRDLGFDPYVMVYEKWNAPQICIDLQRWVNSKRVFRTIRNFEDYDRKKR
jgi:hypothetical protein